MDEEAVGLFGILLIVTILALSHPLKPSQAMTMSVPMPSLASLSWHNMVGVFSCNEAAAQDCARVASQ